MRKQVGARGSQRETEGARVGVTESHREPERDRERARERQGESQRKPQREPQREPVRVRGNQIELETARKSHNEPE